MYNLLVGNWPLAKFKFDRLDVMDAVNVQWYKVYLHRSQQTLMVAPSVRIEGGPGPPGPPIRIGTPP